MSPSSPLSKVLLETNEAVYVQPLSASFLLLMKKQQRSQHGRMPATLDIKPAASKLLSIKEVIRWWKQQWKIVVLLSTLCQVLSETDRISAPTKQMEIILLHWDKAGLPPRSCLHNYISLPELSLSAIPTQISFQKGNSISQPFLLLLPISVVQSCKNKGGLFHEKPRAFLW